MLQIQITGITSNGGLTIEENGRSNNGHSPAKKGEDVHWKVKPNCGVKYIHTITRKTIFGSTNVFSSDPPRAQDAGKKHWKGTVNDNAEDFSVYVYSIEWVKDTKTEEKEVFDPIISIKPSTINTKKFILYAITVVLGYFTLKFLRKHRK